MNFELGSGSRIWLKRLRFMFKMKIIFLALCNQTMERVALDAAIFSFGENLPTYSNI